MSHSAAMNATACPVLSAYARGLHAILPSDRRAEMLPLVACLTGTLAPGLESARAKSLALAAVRLICPPAFERAAEMAELAHAAAGAASLLNHAAKLRAPGNDLDAARDAALAAADAADAITRAAPKPAGDAAAAARDAARAAATSVGRAIRMTHHANVARNFRQVAHVALEHAVIRRAARSQYAGATRAARENAIWVVEDVVMVVARAAGWSAVLDAAITVLHAALGYPDLSLRDRKMPCKRLRAKRLRAVHGDGLCRICGEPKAAEGGSDCSYPHGRLPGKLVAYGRSR